MVTYHGSVTKPAPSPSGRTAEKTKASEVLKATDEQRAPSKTVTIKQHFQFMVNESHRRVQGGDTPSYGQISVKCSVSKTMLYKQITSH